MRLAIGPDIRDLPAFSLQGIEAEGVLLLWRLGQHYPSIYGHGEWLYELIGTNAYIALVEDHHVEPQWNEELLEALRDVAHGLWLRDWWPTSERDAIAHLNHELLEAELAQRAEELEEFCTLDLEVKAGVREGPSQSEYALVAGDRTGHTDRALASGTAPITWQAVPAGIFDAAEDALSWSVEAAPDPQLHVAASLLATSHLSPEGFAVRAQTANLQVTGVLSDDGHGTLPLPMTALDAWLHDFNDLEINVGVAVDEPASLRDEVRRFAARCLANPRYQAEEQATNL